jgi:hypothetical protein
VNQERNENRELDISLKCAATFSGVWSYIVCKYRAFPIDVT